MKQFERNPGLFICHHNIHYTNYNGNIKQSCQITISLAKTSLFESCTYHWPIFESFPWNKNVTGSFKPLIQAAIFKTLIYKSNTYSTSHKQNTDSLNRIRLPCGHVRFPTCNLSFNHQTAFSNLMRSLGENAIRQYKTELL